MNMKTSVAKTDLSPSERITQQISELEDWRGEILAKLRRIILEADPGICEEWKWGTAGWSRNGMLCSAAAFKDHVKINFFNGAALEDPKCLFNAGLDAKESRSIDISRGDIVNEAALQELVRAAVSYNSSLHKKK